MASASKSQSWNRVLASAIMFTFAVLIPLFGQALCTVYIIGDDYPMLAKIAWIVVVWIAPFIGPALYVLVGQRRNRIIPLEIH